MKFGKICVLWQLRLQFKREKSSVPQKLAQDSVPKPDSFLCPITKELMNEPVATVDGNVWGKAAPARPVQQQQLFLLC